MRKLWTGWEKRHLWPTADPTGYLFLGHAFDAVGQKIFDSWTGYEVEDAEREFPYGTRIPSAHDAYIDGKPHRGLHDQYGPLIRGLTPSLDPSEPIPPALWSAVASDAENEWRRIRGAIFRRDEVVNAMSSLAAQGSLTFASRPKGGGSKPVIIPAEAWEIDYPWVPFATLGFGEDLGLSSPTPTSWLFVEGASLERAIGSDNPTFSAAGYLAQVAAEEAVSEWLFADGSWCSSREALASAGGPGSEVSVTHYAGTDDGQRPILRTRCIIVDGVRADGSTISRTRRDLHSWFWSNLEEVRSDWQAGLFVRRDFGRWRAISQNSTGRRSPQPRT